jgi:hypothetical protein
MRNTKDNFLFFFYVCFVQLIFNNQNACFSQRISHENFNQFIETRIFSYATDSLHARGIAIFDNSIFTANNNGHVYQLNLKTNESNCLTHQSLPELRDIFVKTKTDFVAMQSNEKSVLLASNAGIEKIISPFTQAVFLDGMDINAKGFGILMGDPVDGMFQVALTSDFGNTWTQNKNQGLKSFEGEGGFAASGTNVQTLNDSTFVFVSGGKKSRFFKTTNFGSTWNCTNLNFDTLESSGPFSVYFWNENQGVIIGGNYTLPNDTTQNCFLTNDGGLTWSPPNKNPSGYKSAVFRSHSILFSCGTNGIDFSLDDGMNWHQLNQENSFAITGLNDLVYFTLTKGRILELKLKI